MAVYKRGYQRYQGTLTGRWARLLVLPRFAWARLMQQRLMTILFVVSMFFPLGCAGYIYISHHLDLLAGFGGNMVSDFVKIDSDFFLVLMNAQATFAVILSAFAGPSLIAPDLGNGALQLYFSRPLSRFEYVMSRMFVLVGVLAPVTLIPGVLLFLMQASMAGWDWSVENWQLGFGITLGFAFWILFVSLVAMSSSAYVKWKVVAGALVAGFFFILAGAAEITNQVLKVDFAAAFNPTRAMNQVWRALLGAEPDTGPSTWECAFVILCMTVLLAWVLERKLRPVEVIR